MCVMCSPVDVCRFVFAGNAIFTLTSRRTEARYTFKVSMPDSGPTRWFVSLLTGPDNTSNYTYLGAIRNEGFCLTKKSKMTWNSTPVVAFRFFVDNVVKKAVIPDSLEVRHEGRCGRCGRRLTVPESIDRGIGPECAEMMGLV